MKIKHQIIVLVGLCLIGCSLLQKDKVSLKKHSQKEELKLTMQQHRLSQQSQLVLIDSNYKDFTLMLYPKGKFTYSLTNGFNGEAERVIIKGKNAQVKILHVKTDVKQDSITLKANYNNEKESSTLVKKEKLKVGFNLVWVLLIVLALIWVYRRFML